MDFGSELEFSITFGGLLCLCMNWSRRSRKHKRLQKLGDVDKGLLLAEMLLQPIFSGRNFALRLQKARCVLFVMNGTVSITELRDSQARSGVRRQAFIGKRLPDTCPLPAFLRHLVDESWLPQRTASWKARHQQCFAEFCDQFVQLVEVSRDCDFWGSNMLHLGALCGSELSKRSRRIPGAFKRAVVRKTRASKVNRRPGQLLEGMAAKTPEKEVSSSNGSNFEAADSFQYLLVGRTAFVTNFVEG